MLNLGLFTLAQTAAENDTSNGLDISLATLEGYAIPLVKMVVILIVGYLLSKWGSQATIVYCEKTKVETTLSRFMSKTVKWLIIVLTLITAISAVGVQVTAFAAVLGALTLAIGLAFQGTLGNIAAGIMLLIFRPFKVGDFIEAAGTTGTVFEIDLFNTLLDTPNNERIIVPNGTLFGNKITNFSFHPRRRIAIDVGVHYDSDLDKAREILLEVVRNVEGGLKDPEPAVVLMNLGDSSVDFSVRLWANSADFWPTRDRLIRACKLALDDANITIPFPQMDVHLFKEGQA